MTKHFPKNRDSLLSRIIRAVFDRGLRGWTLAIHIGPGAGYGRWIFNRRIFIPTGWTFHIGRNVRNWKLPNGQRELYRDRKWSIGLTKNGNSTPYASH